MMECADDLDRIMAVMEAAFDPAFGEAWSRRQVEDAMLIGNCHYLLVDSRGHPPPPGIPAAGFSLSRCSLDEEELLLFAVHPGFRRKGLGRNMLFRLTEAARARGIRRLMLEMRRGNPAEALYRAFGFRPVGERKNYYRSGSGEAIDAITFAYTIE
ncbi:MAG: GNAT family N-acetyltransferase [Novosphingobium sp.]|nr:GNAT family N-acetyltransferase [Novosphingobium sp.]MCP5403563.1 GNAT family N-acetyltransferase [Novosphingobium sp.]